MTKLLVSVRSAEEARTALAGGVDLIDVKEPRRGALGAADEATLVEIAAAVDGRVPLSAALGELAALSTRPAFETSTWADYRFTKVGLAGTASLANWGECWQEVFAQLPANIQPVAVIYADWRTCGAPSPDEVLGHADAIHAAAVLVDTFEKSRGDIHSYFSLRELAEVIDAARAMGQLSVIAGSLTLQSASRLLPLGPDFLAVRGGACHGGREGIIDVSRVRDFAQLVAGTRV